MYIYIYQNIICIYLYLYFYLGHIETISDICEYQQFSTNIHKTRRAFVKRNDLLVGFLSIDLLMFLDFISIFAGPYFSNLKNVLQGPRQPQSYLGIFNIVRNNFKRSFDFMHSFSCACHFIFCKKINTCFILYECFLATSVHFR